MTDGLTRPLRPDFAAQVAAESWRLAIAGDDDPDADPWPVRLLSADAKAARQARIDAENTAIAARASASLAAERRAAIEADPALATQLAGLLAPAAAAAADVSLVTEGIPQHVRFRTLDSLNSGSTDSGISDGALALAPRPNREERRRSDDPHVGHKCCQDHTLPRRSLALVGRDRDAERDGRLAVLVLPVRCRSWRCTCCKWRLLARNRKRAIKGALAPGEQTWFVTVTIDPTHPRYRAWLRSRWPAKAARAVRGRPVTAANGGVIEAGGRLLTGRQANARRSIPYVSESWNRLRLDLDRTFGGRLRYYRAIELHQSGMAHVHLLARTGSRANWFLHYGVLRAKLRAAGFGGVTDVQLISTPEKAARYVTKMTAAYTSKDSDLMPRWTRRGTWSRDWSEWTKPTRLAGFSWELARSAAPFVADGFAADVWRLLDPGQYRIPPAPA